MGWMHREFSSPAQLSPALYPIQFHPSLSVLVDSLVADEMSPRTKICKRRIKEWGIRKNIKADEACDLASGQKTECVEFWLESRRSNYHIRIARHLKKGKHATTKPVCERPCPRGSRGPQPALFSNQVDVLVLSARTTSAYSSNALGSVELGLHYTEIWFQAGCDATRRRDDWHDKPTTAGIDTEDQFTMLFSRGFEKPRPQRRGPSRCVACSLARHCQQLSLVIHGAGHPIQPCLTADIGMVEYGRGGPL